MDSVKDRLIALGVGKRLGSLALLTLAAASAYYAVWLFRYEDEGSMKQLSDLLGGALGVSLLFTAGACLDIVRRWWNGKRATRLHRILVCAPLVLVGSLLAIVLCAVASA